MNNRSGLLFGLWFSLALPSIAVFKKAGGEWALAYFIFSLVGVWAVTALFRLAQRRIAIRWGLRGLATLCALSATVTFFVVHPIIDETGIRVGAVEVGASDTDDAIDVGISALLAGKNPYRESTFLGNPLTPLPGAFLMASPFYLLKNSALQNLFWIGLLILLFARTVGRPASASALLILLILGSPCVLYRIVQGGDYFSNNIYILLAMMALWKGSPERGTFWLPAAVFAGIAYASRPNFLFLGPMMLLLLSRKYSWRHSFRIHMISGATFCLLVLPFWIHDPSSFSPLHLAEKVEFGSFGSILRWMVPAVGLTVSVMFGMWGDEGDNCALFRYAFWIQLLMVFMVMLFASIHAGHLRWYAEPVLAFLFMFFGVYGYGVPLFRKLVESGI
ncbi:hypothetical protein [Tichowtungia aerotolerans]|uniref:Glycosyltransferase RgtA/B/C/D-like domain-containing protein n=1 Tax=Tichowtungia aerotolerans TaxID=2697043 RepID=A0A6P1M8H6_9BACT|nr:hypothetical protein [Tichowtungia aerotolerans]QHI70197.1 hypothetical protein GT409_12355 [Tichowtungia aerotolerans]